MGNKGSNAHGKSHPITTPETTIVFDNEVFPPTPKASSDVLSEFTHRLRELALSEDKIEALER
jgi:hypothetical protein